MTRPRGADLRSADLRNADLRSADLRGATLSGVDLLGANMSGALLHGAMLSDTAFGHGTLGHCGGDPELDWIYNPVVEGARADDMTRWPAGFGIGGKGILYDGPPELIVTVTGQTVDCPIGEGGEIYSDPSAVVVSVLGWIALLRSSTGERRTMSGAALLAHNLRLVVGQLAEYDGQWWRVVAGDQGKHELSMANDKEVLVVSAQELADNLDRWWWHVRGADRRDG